MGKEILKSDLCIVSGGNTLFESIATATPTIVVPCGRENNELAEILAKKGYILKTKTDSFNKTDFYKLFKDVQTKETLLKLHRKCKKFDGYGLKKIAYIIKNQLPK